MSEGKEPLQVFLDAGVRRRFKLVCTAQGRSMAEVVREFVVWYTRRKESDGESGR